MKMKIFKGEVFWIVFLGVLALAINNGATVYRFLNAPRETIYNGTEFWSEDHSIYAGHFKEGQEGVFLIHDKHTSEPHKGFILRREYIIWGFLAGRILRLPPPFIYHSARFLGGIGLVLVIYLLISKVFKSRFLRIAAFFSVLFLAGIAKIDLQGKEKINLFLPWLTEIDPVIRFSVLWHYLIGGICFIGVVLAFWKYTFEDKEPAGMKAMCFKFWPAVVKGMLRKKSFWLAVILGGFGGSCHPSTLATLYFMFAFYVCFLAILAFLKRYSLQKWLKRVVFVGGFFVFTLPVVVVLKLETERFPWNIIAGWDKTETFLPFWPLVLTVGPIVGGGLLGAVIVIYKSLKEGVYAFLERLWLLLSWGLSSFLLMFGLWSLTGINKIRFAQNPFYLPLGILTVFGLWEIFGKLKKGKKMVAGIILGLFVIGLPSYIYGVRREFTKFPIREGLLFSRKSWLKGIEWLDKNTDPGDVVLACYEANMIIPGFSGNTVYFGHSWSTIDNSRKKEEAVEFFQGKMDKDRAEKFLKKGGIDFVFYSIQEKSYGGEMEKYLGSIEPVYSWEEGIIYKVAIEGI